MEGKIGIISYGCGNVQSVKNAVVYCGMEPGLIQNTQELDAYDKLILPGVGAFDHAMKNLEDMAFISTLSDWVKNEKNKLLGICLGMQLLCNGSEESVKNMEGLGLIDANVNLLKSNQETRLPNVGWSEVVFNPEEYAAHSGDYYFVHSYGVFCNDIKHELAYSYYGDCKFSSAITNGKNVFGYQFHPEKSHKRGLGLLKGFFDL